jgi:hypothetical protein
MNREQANKHLENAGFPGLFVSKADGVWYLLGDDGVTHQEVERCLHVVRLDDMTVETLNWKLGELTAVERSAPANPGFCCATCGAGLDFGCRCSDW